MMVTPAVSFSCTILPAVSLCIKERRLAVCCLFDGLTRSPDTQCTCPCLCSSASGLVSGSLRVRVWLGAWLVRRSRETVTYIRSRT